MGTFVGHVVPGSFFVLFGTWWAVQIFRRYYRCMQKKDKFTSSVSFDWKAENIVTYPVEDVLKIVGAFLGTAGEVYTGFVDPKGFPLANGQHITMYFFFGMSAIIDIIVMKTKLPRELHLDYVTFLMAFLIEFLLFKFHLHGRVRLDVQVHQLLIIAIFGNFICVLIEACYRHFALAALGRSYFAILQGSWFIQLGFILYNPVPDAAKWDDDNEGQLDQIVTLFMWHCIAVFLGMLLIGP
ncbi:hypothetical protein FSP39_023782 [Pinctada imbricata]|uniref:Transmembrane protein 45B n=1 Tax=Pinctada imbricata TaxID=66713 RepID=A0AA88YXM2_PINIB|nr:hypothetical protein FSP39_023782 [Pinctada imbricata]